MSDNDEELALLPFDDGSAGRVIRRHVARWPMVVFSVVDVIAVLTDSSHSA